MTKTITMVRGVIFVTVILVITVLAVRFFLSSKDAIPLDYEITDRSGVKHQWFVLEENSYTVLDEIGQCRLSRTRSYHTQIWDMYYYFEVQVHPSNGEDFVFVIRVRDEAEMLRNGETPELRGLINYIDDVDHYELNDGEESHRLSLNVIYQSFPLLYFSAK